MKGSRTAVIAVVAVVLVALAWWLFTRSSGSTAIDLVEQLETATKQPAGGAFEVVDADLNGDTRRAIAVPADSRITYKVQVPDNAWLKVSVGVRPESWTLQGNGSLFLVGVSDGRSFDELFRQHVNPFGNQGDRKWIQVWVDLSAYAGEEVNLIFNARASPDREAPDTTNDAPLWGAPEVVVR